jgi:hypothetical protein
MPNSDDVQFLRIKSVGGAPVVGSPTLATAVIGRPFTYRILASGEPTSYGASGLPAGFSVDPATGVITGTATSASVGEYTVSLTATNSSGTSTPRALRLVVPGLPQLVRAASRVSHGVNFTLYDADLPLTGAPGVECRRSPDGSRTLVFIFNNEVLQADATIISNAGTQTRALTVGSGSATLDLYSVANAQLVTIKLQNITDYLGQQTPEITFRVGFLEGDVNADGVVNAGDALQTRGRSGQATDATNFRFDINRDGTVNSGDALLVRSRSGTSLP